MAVVIRFCSDIAISDRDQLRIAREVEILSALLPRGQAPVEGLSQQLIKPLRHLNNPPS